jgi:hypothetical protein
MPEILASHENLGGYTKYRRLVKIQACDRTLAGVKISAPIKNLRAWPKYQRKSLASAYYLGSAESPTADFLLVWLKSSCSDPRRDAASQTCRPQVEVQLRPLHFYGWRLSRTVSAGCIGPTCQNSRGCPKSWRPRKFSPIPVKTSKFYLGS